jgi:hypothetical protein
VPQKAAQQKNRPKSVLTHLLAGHCYFFPYKHLFRARGVMTYVMRSVTKQQTCETNKHQMHTCWALFALPLREISLIFGWPLFQ